MWIRRCSSEFNEAYLLALGVQGGGGLVQEQDLGVAYDRPGDGDALLLSARKLRTLRADVGVVFLRQEGRRRLKVLNIEVRGHAHLLGLQQAAMTSPGLSVKTISSSSSNEATSGHVMRPCSPSVSASDLSHSPQALYYCDFP